MGTPSPPPPTRLGDPWTTLFVLAAIGNVITALWMLASPMSWYTHLPGAVPDFGPYNEHFIRDLGCMFLTWGGALAWAAWSPPTRIVILTVLCAWFGGHALVHVYDTARGFVPAAHWLLDIPLCYAPAGLLVVMLVIQRRTKRVESTDAR
jgi:hypothetical protein